MEMCLLASALIIPHTLIHAADDSQAIDFFLL